MKSVVCCSQGPSVAEFFLASSNSMGFPLEVVSGPTIDKVREKIQIQDSLVVTDIDFFDPLTSEIGADVILLIDGNRIDENFLKRVLDLSDSFSSFCGVWDIARSLELQIPHLRYLLSIPTVSLLQKNGGNAFTLLSTSLDSLVSSSLKELQRVKKLHQKLVPMRREKAKGICVHSKFAAGDSAGGEFFDFIKGQGEHLLLLTSSDSYIISSLVLSHFEKLREKKNFSNTDLESFLEGLFSELEEKNLLEDKKLEVLLGKVDIKTMNVSGYCFGKMGLISKSMKSFTGNDLIISKAFFDKAMFNFKMGRGEKFLLVSPGVFKNIEETNDMDLFSFVSTRLEMPARDLIHEISYQLKRGSEGNFLKHDASIIHIEVDPNVIVQV